jgi:hypothetical protein
LPQSQGGESRFPIVVDFLAYTVNRRLVGVWGRVGWGGGRRGGCVAQRGGRVC